MTEQAGLVFSVGIAAFPIAVLITPRLSHQFNGIDGCIVFGLIGAGV
jgi:hypothetical protein